MCIARFARSYIFNVDKHLELSFGYANRIQFGASPRRYIYTGHVSSEPSKGELFVGFMEEIAGDIAVHRCVRVAR